MKNTIIILITYLVSFSAIAENKWIYNSNKDCAIYDSFSGDGIEIFWTGECKNGKADGEGIAVIYDKKEPRKRLFEYQGKIVGGKYQGNAFLKQSGERLSGTFNNGKLNGLVYEKKGIGRRNNVDEFVYKNGKKIDSKVIDIKSLSHAEAIEIRRRTVEKYSKDIQYRYSRRDVHAGKKSSINSDLCEFILNSNTVNEYFGRVRKYHYYRLMDCYTFSGQATKAIQLYKDKSLDAKNVSEYESIATAYFFAKDYEKSFKYLELVQGPSGSKDKSVYLARIMASSHFNSFGERRKRLLTDYASKMALLSIKLGRYKQAEFVCEIGGVCNTYVNHKDNIGQTALIRHAKYAGHEKYFDFLLSNGANVNEPDNYGKTALMQAAYSNQVDNVSLLINHGANVNSVTENGNTALKYAIQENHIDMVKVLVEAGADINHSYKSFDTPLMLASDFGYFDLVRYLINQGVKVNDKLPNGVTALSNSVFRNYDNVTKLLVDSGADQMADVTIYAAPSKIKTKYSIRDSKLKSISHFYEKTGALKSLETFNSEESKSVKTYTTSGNLKCAYTKIRTEKNGKESCFEVDRENKEKNRLNYVVEYEHGNILAFERYFYDNNKRVLKQKVKFNQLLSLYEETEFYYTGERRKTASFILPDKFSFRGGYFYSRKYMGKKKEYSKKGTLIKTEKYDGSGSKIGGKINYKSAINQVFNKYISDPHTGVLVYFLQLESELGHDVKKANQVIESLMSDVRSKIQLKSNYSRSEARAIMNKIGETIKQYGFEYDTEHSDLIVDTIKRRRMDCDIISYLYLTISERLKLPLFAVPYPGHMALLWNEPQNSFYWEATGHQELSLNDYQSWLGNENYISLSKSNRFAKPLTREEVFFEILILLSRTSNTAFLTDAYKSYLFDKEYLYSYSIPNIFIDYREGKKKNALEFARKVETIRNEKYQKSYIPNKVKIARQYYFTGYKNIWAEKIINLLASDIYKLEKNDNLHYSLYELSQAYEHQKRYVEAIDALERYYRLYPTKTTKEKLASLNNLLLNEQKNKG